MTAPLFRFEDVLWLAVGAGKAEEVGAGVMEGVRVVGKTEANPATPVKTGIVVC